jgi:hypothetical protein
MTITVSISQGQGYRLGQPLYFGGQFLRIQAIYPLYDQGRVIGYNVEVTKYNEGRKI